MEITEGKMHKGGVGRQPKTKRPTAPIGQRGRHKPKIEPKPFACECGTQFFKHTTKSKVACIKCKGIAKESDLMIHPKPVWKEVKELKPFCPRCGSAMRRVTDPDVRTMFDWRCSDSLHCNFVC